MTRTGSRLALIAAVVLVVVSTLTTGSRVPLGADGTPTWRAFACVTCAPTWLADIISNIALFVPLGGSLAALGVRRSRAGLIGVLASAVIELLQYSGHPVGRTSSVADVVSNGVGTFVGALVVSHASLLIAPSPRHVVRLAVGWTAITTAVFVVCSVVLSPVARWGGEAPRRDALPQLSALPFTPGYGWYAAYAEQPTVNGVPMRHEGSGPVMVSMRYADVVRAEVQVRGRDARDGVVPFVFVHRPIAAGGDSLKIRAVLWLGQRGSDAVLGSELMSQRWGLAAPLLVAPNAFVGVAVKGGEGDTARTTRFDAQVTPRRWQLSWWPAGDSAGNSAAPVATLDLSIALGWALIQSLVGVEVPGAWVLSLVWLAAWFAPLGYWAAAATGGSDAGVGAGRPLAMAAALAAGVLSSSWLASAYVGCAPPSIGACAVSVLAALGGAALALWHGRARGQRRAGVPIL